MAADAEYKPIPLIYKSKGLIARYVTDETPPGFFVDFRNMLERAENSVSSRYGVSIITRDPIGVGTQNNYHFTSPIVHLDKLVYGGLPFRYASDAAGNLWRRAGNAQGAYTQVYVGLSGNPYQSLTTTCFETSQPFLFMFDGALSIKDYGVGTPTLIGIDPPAYTANTQPYSPLLTLIDNFASNNTYDTFGTGAAWTEAPAYTAVTTLTASSSQQVTDFPEFMGITNDSGTGNGATYPMPNGPFGQQNISYVYGSGSNALTSDVFSGFPDVILSLDSTTTITVDLESIVVFNLCTTAGNWSSGTGTVNFQYSLDGGVTWITFFSLSQSVPNATATIGYPILTPNTTSFTVSGITNLSLIQVQISASTTGVYTGGIYGPGSPNVQESIGQINSISATINVAGASDAFAGVVDGMLSVLAQGSTNPPAFPTQVQITSIVTQVQSLDGYSELLVTCQSQHAYVPGDYISIYGCTSDLVDGYYQVVATPSQTQFVVLFFSSVYINASGGSTYGGDPLPATCMIDNHQSSPYPTQFSGLGFYQQVPLSQSQFPVGAWAGYVAANTPSTAPAIIGQSVNLNLSMNNQVTPGDLICCTLLVGDPSAINNIRLQFDVRGSNYTSSYYYKDISPAYYQQGVSGAQTAYETTENQILGDALGLISGQPANTLNAQLQPGNIGTGNSNWITVYIPIGNFVAVGTAGQPGLDWSAVTGWQLVVTTTTVGGSTVALNGLYLQWGYGPSSFAGTGYDWRYTYYNQNTGTEGNPSPIQTFNQQFGWLSSLAAPFYMRQAAQVTGYYSTDPQVTHVRIYRRGGTMSENWYQVDQFPNAPPEYIKAGNIVGHYVAQTFAYKDVVADANLAQSKLLVLDNDPPITSSLRTPIQTTLMTSTVTPGSSIYSAYTTQTLYVALATASFVLNQIVVIGNTNNLEQVTVTSPGIGYFSAIPRLQHNAGEPVYVYSLPRVACNLCAIAYNMVWLAGDKNNPNFLYFSKPGLPENYGPQNYIEVGSANHPIMIVVNWRGTLFVATTKTWWIIVGPTQQPQPTGSIHGAISSEGWTQSEGGIWYRALDGYRKLTGADGVYMTLPVEFLFKQTPLTPVPLTDPTAATGDIMAFYGNQVICSYQSLTLNPYGDPIRYRLIFDTNYNRYRYDDIGATAMLWELDTNMLVVAMPAPGNSPSNPAYMICQDMVPNQDYDDGGWLNSELQQTPIALTIQWPYSDLGAPHFPKNWNILEVDADTAGQPMSTTLLFDTEPPVSLPLATVTTTTRDKVQLQISDGTAGADGFEAYSMAIQHTMLVTSAPTFYQENMYATILADYRTSFDTYWIKFNSDESKIVKQGYFDYTATAPITVNLYVDGNMSVPYFTFMLPVPTSSTGRADVRQLFAAMKCRLWRMIGSCPTAFQLWSSPQIEQKPIKEGSTYAKYEAKI